MRMLPISKHKLSKKSIFLKIISMGGSVDHVVLNEDITMCL